MCYLLENSLDFQRVEFVYLASDEHGSDSDYVQPAGKKGCCFLLEVAVHKLDAVEVAFI